MRIGIDARLWNQTGVGRYIRNLVENLQEIDKKNDYVLFARKQDNVRVKNSNFRIIYTEIKWHSIAEQLKLSRVLYKEKLDLVHFPYYSVPVFYNKPFVVTLHDLIPLHFQTGKASTLPFPFYKFKFFAYSFVVSQAAKKAKKIISPSNATKKDIVNYLKVPSSKVEVIYEGVDENLKNKESSGKENIILYVGNAYPHKNLETLLLAIKNIPDMKLTLVGKEDYFYKRLKTKVNKMGLENQVFFYGFAKEKELSMLYKKAKALVIPSFIEGFGLPALEAMANNCLVIASDIPVLHEVCEDAAVYFDPNNPNDLNEKLKDLDSNKFQGKIGKGLVRVGQFSWKKTAQQTLKLYESSIGLRQN